MLADNVDEIVLVWPPIILISLGNVISMIPLFMLVDGLKLKVKVVVSPALALSISIGLRHQFSFHQVSLPASKLVLFLPILTI